MLAHLDDDFQTKLKQESAEPTTSFKTSMASKRLKITAFTKQSSQIEHLFFKNQFINGQQLSHKMQFKLCFTCFLNSNITRMYRFFTH